MWRSWYENLTKPGWTPNSSTITSVWILIYPIIFISYFFVFRAYKEKKLNFKTLLPFILNLIANFSFIYFFFSAKSLKLATLDILIVLITIIWTILAIRKFNKYIAIAQLPYLLWIIITTYLQIAITTTN